MRFIIILFFLKTATLAAQLPVACPGGSPAVNCETACINCNFNGYVGSTTGFPSGIVPTFCGTVENAQWLGFIAGGAHATFTVTPNDCLNGDGIQIALYTDCAAPPLDCEKGALDGGNQALSITSGLTPGANYFLMIDGFAGDQCDFRVTVSPSDALFEPPLGLVGPISGPTAVCPGATFTYSVEPVPGASAYIWSGPPGARIDTLPLPQTLVGNAGHSATITFDSLGGQICVQAANTCKQNPPCSSSLDVQLLDDSHRPEIQADTLDFLSCTGEPISFEIAVKPPATYTFSWTSDSTGNIVSGANALSPKVNQTGIYTLVATIAQTGCSSSQTVRVAEPDVPTAAVFFQKNSTCYGYDDGELRVDSVLGGQGPMLFSIDNQAFKFDPRFDGLPPGEHLLLVETADGCRWDTLIDISQPDEWLLDLGPDTTLHLGQTIRLWHDGSVSEPDRLLHVETTPAGLLDSLCDGCPFLPKHSMQYSVTAWDSVGCRATDERTIVVTTERKVFIPNVFAPAATGGNNDRFVVFGGEDVASVRSLRVFNRQGKTVFERLDFQPNDPLEGWDGVVSGQQAPPAVYVFVAEIEFKDGVTERFAGDVTVLR